MVASAPQAAVELSTSALWSGRIVPARVELIEPRLFLFYSDGGGLSMSFSKPVEGDWSDKPLEVPAPTARLPADRTEAAAAGARPASPLKRIDLARAVTDMSARARKRLDASSYLKEFGLRNATVVLEYAGKSTEWRVPVLAVELMHGRARSVISGRATIASGARPWQLTFETDEFEQERTLNLKTSIKDLVPRSLAPAVPQLSLLQAFDMPIAGEATLKLSTDGDIRAATLGLNIGHGSLRLPALPEAPLEVDGGVLEPRLRRLGPAGRRSRPRRCAGAAAASPWRARWRTSARGRSPRPGPIGSTPAKASLPQTSSACRRCRSKSWRANGRIIPQRGEIELADFNLKAGGAEIALKGDLVAGVDPASTRLEGTLSPMPLGTLKALWPKAVAPGARTWVGEHVTRGDVLGGTFQLRERRRCRHTRHRSQPTVTGCRSPWRRRTWR